MDPLWGGDLGSEMGEEGTAWAMLEHPKRSSLPAFTPHLASLQQPGSASHPSPCPQGCHPNPLPAGPPLCPALPPGPVEPQQAMEGDPTLRLRVFDLNCW